jgi:hypothetical protein
MYLQKARSRKNFKLFFCVGILKVSNENSRIRMRIHTKMSWIRNIDFYCFTVLLYGALPEVAPDLSLAGRNVAHEELEEGGLADPVGPDNRHPGGHVDAEFDVLEEGRLAGVVETEQGEKAAISKTSVVNPDT